MNEQKMVYVPLEELNLSPLNPRKHFDQRKMNDLIASIKEKGILLPLLVRKQGKKYEIVSGARRFKAAEAAGIKKAPVIVRDLDDQSVLEIQIIENSQREDIHPLEEAEGYAILSRRPGYNTAKIAEKVGRSEKYIYDRIKLYKSLTKEAKDLFIKNNFTASHAILLARLGPTDQKRAMDPYRCALFNYDQGQYDLDGNRTRVKPRSVREFEDWIEDNVRFERDKVDPMLFPDTAKVMTDAKEKKEKVVAITAEHFVQTSARADERTIVPTSWRRADGKHKSKTCEHSVIGVFVAGKGRGQTMEVCIAKEKCKVHWGQWQKDRAKRQKDRGKQSKDPKTGKTDPVAEAKARRKGRVDAMVLEQIDQKVLEGLLSVLSMKKVDEIIAPALIELVDQFSQSGREVLEHRKEKGYDVGKYAKTLNPLNRALLLVEMVARHAIEEDWQGGDFLKIAKDGFGVNVDRIEKHLREETTKKVDAEIAELTKKAQAEAKPEKKKTQNEKIQDAMRGRQAAAKEKREKAKDQKKKKAA